MTCKDCKFKGEGPTTFVCTNPQMGFEPLTGNIEEDYPVIFPQIPIAPAWCPLPEVLKVNSKYSRGNPAASMEGK